MNDTYKIKVNNTYLILLFDERGFYTEIIKKDDEGITIISDKKELYLPYEVIKIIRRYD